ncbi:MAG: hypothetical protein ACFCVD_07920 [Nodosilinea sp.]
MISVSHRKIIWFLSLFLLGLTLINLAGQIFGYFFDQERLEGLRQLFDVNNENNIPTWFSAINLLFCSVLMWLIATIQQQHKKPQALYWRGLSVIFFLLSLDEASSVHELFIPIGEAFGFDGFLRFFWVVPGMFFVAVVAIIYWKFILTQPARIRNLILTAATVYISGAVIMEMIGGHYVGAYLQPGAFETTSGWNGMAMALILAAEEFLEMLGILIFIYALLLYLATEIGKVDISFKEKISLREDLSQK